ncbi:MAG: ABC transporter permease subunit [Lachnospiraceae bacterium]|nr:ABC transporter permease subunit [Lachnospiraceae bacterium]MCM1215646.1 ABC transporter permease subunit [Lachnospiraceae bacterium]MCM1238484.1 ABC transporter permease subunit [Lachnospiraceae bacterium]
MGVKTPFIKRLWKNMATHPLLYLMILPVLAYFVVYHYYPMYGMIISFFDYVPTKGIFGSNFVGLKHFRAFLEDPYFFRTMRNTLSINLLLLLFGFPFPIVFAILLNELRSARFRKVTQTVTYMPHFISTVVICGLMLDFCKSKGVITTIMSAVSGMEPINLFSQSAFFQPLYVLMCIWQEFGWDSIIYFAALTSIDQTLYEAADIDGAGRWKKILHITIPGISPTIIILLIMRIGNMMTLGWDKILLLYNPMIYEKADVISTYVYRIGLMNFQYSFSTAVGVFNSVINFLLLLSANAVSRKVNETSLW